MSAIDNNEISIDHREPKTGVEDVELGNLISNKKSGSGTSERYGIRKTKKLIYFSDGQTMEDPEDETDYSGQDDGIEKPFEKVVTGDKLQSGPPIDPKTLSWPEWMKYYSSRGGSNLLVGLEGAGETLAYYLGITTPKYQHEIDEYYKIEAKEKAEEAEVKAWASTNPSSVPIMSDPAKTDDLEATK